MDDTERRQEQTQADAIVRQIDKLLDKIEAVGEGLEKGSPPEDLSGLEERFEHPSFRVEAIVCS